MKASKMDQNSEARSKLKVVKVVQLKRFMPKLDASPVFTKKICFNNFDAHSRNATENVDIKNQVLDDSIVKIETELNAKEIDVPGNFEDSSSLNKTKLINRNLKMKFNGCSHTAKELTKLTEHYDETLVTVGSIFESREAFRKYINENAKRWFYYYVCRTSKKNLLEYNCTCMAYKLQPKANIIRRQKKRTTACPCKIRLAVEEDTKKVIVYYVCNHHDHDLTETAFCHYPHAKYLPQEVKEVFLDLAYLGLDVDLIQKYIYSLIGLTIKRKDISSYAYKFKKKTLQRNLTVERRKYINDLITTIQGVDKETMDVTLQGTSEEDFTSAPETKTNKPEQCNREKSQRNSKEVENNSLDKTIYDDVNMNYEEPEENILGNLLESNEDLNNYDVIIQYINEKGILCDQNGAPVTNSSAIMQFITNYEYMMHETSVKDEFLEEGTVFSELVENNSDDIYPLDWDSVQETKAVIEELDEVDKTSVEATEDVATNANIEGTTVDHELDPGQDKNSNYTSSVTVLSNIIVNCDKRLSPTRSCPAAYAEMDNFKKYYFVDHRYIKHESVNNNDRPQKATKETQLNRRERLTTCAIEHGEEYVKAPEFKHFPTPLKRCSGHDSLISLSDADVILPGAKFLTHEVFLKYVNERASRWFFYYSLVESGKVPEFYVYKCVFGKHRASKNAYRAKGLRKRSKLTTQCPCQIRLRRLYSEPTYLTVLYSCNHHDHALDAQLFEAQPHSRRLPGHIKEEIKDFLSLGAKYDVLRKYVTSETGLRIYDKYFHNVRVKMAKDGESRQFTEERFAALTRKLQDLEAKFGSASKENPQYGTVQGLAEKRWLSSSQIQMEDVQVGFQPATQTPDYNELEKIDNIAEEVCVAQSDSSQTPSPRKHGRLETRLKNLSSLEETLLNVKKLQESVRSDNLRNTYEVVQYSLAKKAEVNVKECPYQ